MHMHDAFVLNIHSRWNNLLEFMSLGGNNKKQQRKEKKIKSL